MEGTKRKLCTGFTNGLCCNNTNGLAFLYHTCSGKVAPIALHADTMLALTGKHRTDLDALDGRILNGLCLSFGNLLAGSTDEFTCCRMDNVVYRDTPQDAFREGGNHLIAIFECRTYQSAQRAAIFLVDDDIVGNVYKTTGEVSCIGCLHSGVGQTLTCTVGSNEVFEHRHAFLEVGKNGVFDDLRSLGTSLLRLGHQSTDTGKLLNLIFRTTGTGIEHHEHSIETLVGFSHLLHKYVTDVVVDVCPCIDNLIVTLVIGDESHVVVLCNLSHLFVTIGNKLLFLNRDDDVIEVERKSGQISHAIAEVLNTVKELASTCKAYDFDGVGNDVSQTLLRDNLIHISHFFGNNTIYDDTSHGSFYECALQLTVNKVVYIYFNGSMEVTLAFIMSDNGLFRSVEYQTLTFRTRAYLGDVIKSKYHILRGYSDRSAISGIQNVVTLQHQYLGFQNGFITQRKMNGHLVTVEVCIESCTCQRM